MPDKLPLTFQQQWLWDAICANESWQCAAARAFRLPGLLDVPLLQQCLQEVVWRHGALRMQIAALNGVSQEIREPEEYPLEITTIEGTCSAEIASNAQRCFEDVCDRKMNRSVEPLWNGRLLKLSEHEHWLVLAMHRLIGDCVSIEQTYRETKVLYSDRLQGRLTVLKPPAQYGDYTLWQQQTAGEWVKRHEPYWNRHLAGAAPLQWPTDTDLAATAPGILGKARCSFGSTLSAGLLDLARAIRTLPAVPMMAIYAAVLWRWCQQEDFVLPLNTAGRPTEYKSAIGYFSYALCLRVHITGAETFRDLVSRIGNEFFTCMSHQDFGRIARQRPELLSGTLFQWVTWHPEETLEERVCVREFGEGLTVVPPGMTALEVTAFDTATGLYAFGSYRTDCFTAQDMERFMADLHRAAEVFVHNPDACIAALAAAEGHIQAPAQRWVPGAAAGA
jgi:Condensation domain